jgi:hypothetical protein
MPEDVTRAFLNWVWQNRGEVYFSQAWTCPGLIKDGRTCWYNLPWINLNMVSCQQKKTSLYYLTPLDIMNVVLNSCSSFLKNLDNFFNRPWKYSSSMNRRYKCPGGHSVCQYFTSCAFQFLRFRGCFFALKSGSARDQIAPPPKQARSRNRPPVYFDQDPMKFWNLFK